MLGHKTHHAYKHVTRLESVLQGGPRLARSDQIPAGRVWILRRFPIYISPAGRFIPECGERVFQSCF